MVAIQVPVQKLLLRFQWQLCFWAATLLALLLRFSLLKYESGDMKVFLIPWLEWLRNNGGFAALKEQFSNYNAPYLYLLALASYLPHWIPASWCVKFVSFPFAVLTAFFVAKIVRLRGYGVATAMLAYFAVLFLPTAILNDAVWGQCDTIYVSFLVMALYYFLSSRSASGMIAFSVAFAFKMQALFFVPALFCLWISNKIKFREFFIVPVIFVLTLIPALVTGRSLTSLLSVYVDQANFYRNLALNVPNFYVWLSDGNPELRIPDTLYDLVTPTGYILTISAILFLGVAVLQRKTPLKVEKIVQLGFVSVLLMPFVLPKMHDRYFFAADVFAVIFAFYFPRFVAVPILMQVASLSVYVNVLFGTILLPVRYAALLVTALVFVVTGFFLKSIWNLETSRAKPQELHVLPVRRCVFDSVGSTSILFVLGYLGLVCVTVVPLAPWFLASEIYIVSQDPVSGIYQNRTYAAAATQDWGIAKFGTDLAGKELFVGGKKFDNAICIHANSKMDFNIDGVHKNFFGKIGLPDYLLAGSKTSVDASVVADGKIVWDSGLMKVSTQEMRSKSFQVDISNIKTLELLVNNGGDGNDADHACWLNLGLR